MPQQVPLQIWDQTMGVRALPKGPPGVAKAVPKFRYWHPPPPKGAAGAPQAKARGVAAMASQRQQFTPGENAYNQTSEEACDLAYHQTLKEAFVRVLRNRVVNRDGNLWQTDERSPDASSSSDESEVVQTWSDTSEALHR